MVPALSVVRSLIKLKDLRDSTNWWLGIDLTFAGIAALMVEIFDLLKNHQVTGDDDDMLRVALALLLGVFYVGVFLALVKIHQQWDCEYEPSKKHGHRRKAEIISEEVFYKRQFRSLFIASNLVGLGIVATFVYLRWRGFI
jgi:hypothetical protein